MGQVATVRERKAVAVVEGVAAVAVASIAGVRLVAGAGVVTVVETAVVAREVAAAAAALVRFPVVASMVSMFAVVVADTAAHLGERRPVRVATWGSAGAVPDCRVLVIVPVAVVRAVTRNLHYAALLVQNAAPS
jgi:hypothetical protein